MVIRNTHIKEIEQYYGYSVEDLAEYAGCSLPKMLLWESGESLCPKGVYRDRLERLYAEIPRENSAPLVPSAFSNSTDSISIKSIEEERKRQGLTKRDLSAMAGKSPTWYNGVLRREPRSKTKELLASILHMSAEQPITDESLEQLRIEQGLTKKELSFAMGRSESWYGWKQRKGGFSKDERFVMWGHLKSHEKAPIVKIPEQRCFSERDARQPLMGERACFPTQIITAEYIDAIRNRMGISVVDIENQLGVSRGAYSHWINRQHIPTKQLKAVCDILGVRIKVPHTPNVRRLRAELGLTRVELGELLGVHDTTIGDCELYGKAVPQKAMPAFLEYWNEVFPQ